MDFTYIQWKAIEHSLTVAQNCYEKHMNESKPSDDKSSFYQIFKRQIIETEQILDKLRNSIL